LTLTFGFLFILAINQIAYTQTQTESEEVSALSELKINYSELNDLIDKIIIQRLNEVVQFFKKYLLIVWIFFLSRPAFIKNIIYISFFPASIGIVTSHVIGINRNRNKWHKHPNHDLMYSYFIKSGTLQRKESYRDAHSLLRDHKWLWPSFAGLAYRLGNYADKSFMLMFAMSFVYIPLVIFGFIEMVLRIFFGTIWLLLFNTLHSLLLFVTKLISNLFIPVSYIIDKAIRKTQYCPHCYETFNLPVFVCPVCGRKHKKLVPGGCGVLFVRCKCNSIFLPCSSFTGRSQIASECPACTGKLAAANAKHFSLVVAGGSSVGKSSFIAAFSNLYIKMAENMHILKIEGKPDNYFLELNEMFNSGKTITDNESRTYSLVHKHGKMDNDNLVFYDILSQYIVSDAFPRSPKFLRFCDGIILIIDPLNVQSVQNELTNDRDQNIHYSSDDTSKVIVQFIHQYNTICGHTAGIMSNIPVAILINKTDIEVIKREIGWTKIRTLYDENPLKYNNNERTAREQICKSYLSKIGLLNVLNNLEATFTNISYFPVSATGFIPDEGNAFAPIGVIDPVAWIVKKKRSRLTRLLINCREKTKIEGLL
jgi:signal recognition particle receptor subunit beta